MDFYVELKLWSPEEASKIKDFTDVTTIASTAGSSSADSESGVTSPHHVYLISSSESDQQKVVHKSSHKQIEVITIDDDDDEDDIPVAKKPAIKRKGQGPGKENRKRLKKHAGTSLLLKVKSPPIERQDCNHLIPPELDFLSPNEFKFDVTDDSVSCSSSESGDLFQDDLKDLKDIRDLKLPQKPISPPKKSTHLEQPIGVDIDIKKLGPPSKAFLDSLPEPPLYPCNRPGCGFTTSDPVNKKHHSCIKFAD